MNDKQLQAAAICIIHAIARNAKLNDAIEVAAFSELGKLKLSEADLLQPLQAAKLFCECNGLKLTKHIDAKLREIINEQELV